MAARVRTLPLPLLLGFLLFLAILGVLVAASLGRRDAAAFAPDAPRPSAVAWDTLGEDTLTVDARDPTRWRFIDIERGLVLDPPDTVGWDLAVRRFHVITSGAVAVVEDARFADVTWAPDDGYISTTFGADTVNAVLARWYRYGFFSHLLEPLDRVWVLRTTNQRYARFTVLSYYCPGLIAGCLTLRYQFQPDGSRAFE
jgi:hypothetical protein